LVYQDLEEENLAQKSAGPPGCGLMQQASLLVIGKRIAKKPIGNNLDGYNLRQHKLRKRTIRLLTWNVQGMRNKRRKYKGVGRTNTRHHNTNRNEEKGEQTTNTRTLHTLL
jgi:hypothetical protein